MSNVPVSRENQETPVFQFEPGSTPLLISMPHAGTYVPLDIASKMTPAALQVADTDWHVDRLYEFARELGAGTLMGTHSRYVIDLNRAPDDRPLYPGASNTELCPTMSFAEAPLYREGLEPDRKEVTHRRELYWAPYHRCLAAELYALRQRHGIALLYEAHTIRSQVPRFFEGRLPDLNLGTGGGVTAHPDLERRLQKLCADRTEYTSVLNGRFQGGYITRHYGRPADGVHAVQLELAQCTYMMEDPPFVYQPASAARIRPLLRALLETLMAWAETA